MTNFPFQSRPATPGQAAPAAGAPPAWGTPAAAPAPVAPPAAAQKFYVIVNGAPVLMDMAQMRTQPPAAPACVEGSQTWLTVAALLPPTAPAAPAAPAAPPGWGAPAAAAPAAPAAPGWGAPAAPAAAQPSYQYQAPQQHQHSQAPQGNGVAPPGMFDGVENAKVHEGGGTRITDGDYIGIYRGAEARTKRDNTGSMVFFEVEIVQSTFNPADPTSLQCNKVGQRVSVCVNRNDSFLGNFKEVTLAISGFDAAGNPRPDDSIVTKDESMAIVGEEQRYVGAMVFLEVRTRPQKRDPTKTFTYINWWPCPRNADGSPDIAKLAATR